MAAPSLPSEIMKTEHIDMVKRIAEIARLHNPKKICDYGCGNGRIIDALKAAGVDASYTGIDFIAGYPELKQKQDARTRYIDRAGAGYQELLRSGEKFDLVFICNSIPHFKHPVREFTNITALMCGGALLYIADINFVNETEVDITRNIECYLEEMLLNLKLLNLKDDFCRHFYAVDEVMDLLEPFGLETLQREEYRISQPPEEKASDTARLLEYYDHWLGKLEKAGENTLDGIRKRLLSAARRAAEMNGADYGARYGLLFKKPR